MKEKCHKCSRSGGRTFASAMRVWFCAFCGWYWP